MTEKLLLVEYISSINNIIHKTFHKSHRVKLTSFDVSSKYVVFGASTGGIYIFYREPCQFLKLIPNMYGSAIIVAISDNEENLAVATATGSVIILENSFNDTNNQQQIFNEHYGQTITTIKWNNYDIYCGDNSGKVSVITTKNFLGKSIFQPPVACLMHLESAIIQIDTYSKLLLISTRQRTLLCDTETECYRQIGKKSRDGPYGSCFFNIPLINIYYELPQKRGIFRLINDDDNNEQLWHDFNDIIIYCARPGVRLWQANSQAEVVLTHQFRSNLIDKQLQQVDLIIIGDDKDARLEIKQFPNDLLTIDTCNFGKIFNLFNRFILTYNQHGFYIFDPKNSELLLWSNYYNNIRDIKIVNSTIYIWYDELRIAVLALMMIDDLIGKVLYRKQYEMCADLCVEFSDIIDDSIEKSDKLQQLSVLETKLNDRELLERIRPILEKIKTLPKTVQLIKERNGIVLINNQFEQQQQQQQRQLESEQLEISSNKSPYDIVVEQYKFNKINKHLETTDFRNLIETIDPNEIYEILQQFCDSTSNNEDYDCCKLWCCQIFLKILSHTENINNLSKSTLIYASESFLIVNNNNNNDCVCKCGFPLPKSHLLPPKFYEIGVKLMIESDDYENFVKTVPYMNRYVLENINNLIDVRLKLALIIQFSDIEIIRRVMMKSTYDIWDESIKLLTKLKQNCCLYCNNNIDIDDCLIWREFLFVIVESINAKNTIELLKSYSNLIPKNELDCFFYQFCIFQCSAEIEDARKLSFFKETIQTDDKTKEEFERSVGGCLNKKYVGRSDIVPSTTTMFLNCDYCEMPLKTPIFDNILKLSCGHNYHKICYISIKEQCPICNKL